MANLKKFTKASCGHMFKHYERAMEINPETGQLEYVKFKNQEINTQASHLNYNLATHQTMRQGDFVRKRCSEVKLQNRKDVKVMCSWALTAPKDLPEAELDIFFRASYEFMAARYGNENVVSAYVHLDETSPHIHFAFVPVTEDKKKGGYKVSAKEVVNRQDLQTFHQDLNKHLEKILGHSVSILNDATKDGNKTVTELKEKSALERARKAEKEAIINEEKAKETAKTYIALKSTLDSTVTAFNEIENPNSLSEKSNIFGKGTGVYSIEEKDLNMLRNLAKRTYIAESEKTDAVRERNHYKKLYEKIKSDNAELLKDKEKLARFQMAVKHNPQLMEQIKSAYFAAKAEEEAVKKQSYKPKKQVR